MQGFEGGGWIWILNQCAKTIVIDITFVYCDFWSENIWMIRDVVWQMLVVPSGK